VLIPAEATLAWPRRCDSSGIDSGGNPTIGWMSGRAPVRYFSGV